MIYLIVQMKWLLIVAIVVGFSIGWFIYQATPIIESTRRLRQQRRTNQQKKNDLTNCESRLRED